MLISRWEITSLKYCEDFKAFIQYSNDVDDIYNNIEEYNLGKKRKILYLTWLLILLSNKKLNPIVTELFVRSRKLNISFVFTTQSYLLYKKKY